MARLSLSFLGSFQASLDGEPLTLLRSTRIQGLLAYLVLESAQAHTRAALAALFWPDEPEQAAKQNVRQAVYQLRQILGGQTTPFLTVTRETVQFRADSDHVLDVSTLLNHLQAGRLKEGVELYRNELLAQLTSGSESFEEWLLLRREQIHMQVMDALHQLTEAALSQGDTAGAQHYARRQLALEPWREHAHRELMLALARSGDRSGALAQYETCRRVLVRELGVEPEHATHMLYEQIRTNHIQSENRSLAATFEQAVIPGPQVCYDWGDAPDVGVLYGRMDELERLSQWITHDHCRVAIIQGLGGMGKTTLAAQVARACADQFTSVIWRSLLNAPSLSELLTDWLHLLSNQQVTHIPASLDAQFVMLFEHLRARRCLLILDNVETILQGGERAGSYRPGYEAYGQLLLRMGRSQHQSCLLVTSREQPREFARLEAETALVRSWPLTGLQTGVGSDLLFERGLLGQGASAEALVERYSGNPLALKLVAEVIHDLFASDIDAFMDDEVLIFDDIREVLDQQFARLEQLERDLLLWLAIEREPVSEGQVWQLFARTVPKRLVLEALRSLLRRSLVEHYGAAFGLQNVVTEYVTEYLVTEVCREFATEMPFVLQSHPLMVATAKEYVRQSQQRIILQLISERLLATYGRTEVEARCKRMLDTARREHPLQPGFLAGNLLNLLLHLGIDLRGYDASHLCVWQAYMRGMDLPGLDFTGSDLTGSVFTDYAGAVTSVAMSTDGQLLATGADNGVISLWDLADRRLIGTCQGHQAHVWSLAWSPNGHYLVSGSDDQTARIWNVATRQTVHILAGHTGGVAFVTVHPDGALVASASTDYTIRVWEVQTGQLLHILQGHSAMIPAVAWSPDGSRLASASHDQTVRVWDWQHEQALHILSGHSGPVVALAFSQSPVAWGDTAHALLITGSHDQTIGIWDAQTYEQIGTLVGHSAPILSMALSADGNVLMSGSDDQTIRVWDLSASGRIGNGQTIRILHDHYGAVITLAAHLESADAQGLLVSGSNDKTVQLWDVPSGRRLATLQGHSKWLQALVFCADGRLLVGGSDGQRVRVWDGWTGHTLHVLRGHRSLTEKLAFRADGAQLASAGWDATTRIWDLERVQMSYVLEGYPTPVVAAVIGPGLRNRTVIASGGLDHAVQLWDAATGTALATCHGHRDRVVAFAFHPEGAVLASGSWDCAIGVWDTESGELVRFLKGHTSPIESVTFHPGGTVLASCSWDGSVRIWDVNTGETIHTLCGHTNGLEMVDFSPDGSLLASCGCDHLVCVWDVQRGQLLYTLQGHTSWVRCVAWSPDGTLLASGSDDGTVKLWDMTLLGGGACRQTITMEDPYTAMKITGITGITEAQRLALKMLGAVEGRRE